MAAVGSGPKRPGPSATLVEHMGAGPKGPGPADQAVVVQGIAPWEGAYMATPEPAQQSVASAEEGATQATPEPPLLTQHGLAEGSGPKGPGPSDHTPISHVSSRPRKMDRAQEGGRVVKTDTRTLSTNVSSRK